MDSYRYKYSVSTPLPIVLVQLLLRPACFKPPLGNPFCLQCLDRRWNQPRDNYTYWDMSLYHPTCRYHLSDFTLPPPGIFPLLFCLPATSNCLFGILFAACRLLLSPRPRQVNFFPGPVCNAFTLPTSPPQGRKPQKDAVAAQNKPSHIV